MSKPQVRGTEALNQTHYTVQDYQNWEDRWELIRGEAWAMSPAPTTQHQDLVLSLGSLLANFLKGKPCQPFVAPTDVYLADDTVVQPDVLVVCDPAIIVTKGIIGAPTFVAEVLSDSTANKDLTVKKALYEAHGVQEYWLVFPNDGRVFVFRKEGPTFGKVQEYLPTDPVPSTSLKGFVWEPREILSIGTT